MTAPRPILILTALESELQATDAPDGVELLYCGVGKVNAALHATRAILERQGYEILSMSTGFLGESQLDPRDREHFHRQPVTHRSLFGVAAPKRPREGGGQ